MYLKNLEFSFLNCFVYTKDNEDIFSAISFYCRSATCNFGAPLTHFDAAKQWALLSYEFDRLQSLEAFHIAIGLLSQLAGLEQTIHKCHANLLNLYDVTASATVVALENGQPKTALTWLEQGRCLVWNQLHQLCTPVDDLHAYNSSLADHFIQVAQQLEISGSCQVTSSVFSEATMMNMIKVQDETCTHVHLANEWNALLSEIHKHS